MTFYDRDSLASRDLGPWFTARYDSECNECFGDIWEGDQARYKEGEVVCEECGSTGDD
jgi:hypothetical protein